MQGLSLHDAARQGDLIRVRQVLAEQEDEAGGEGGKPANERDKHARTPLHLASWAGHLEVVEELLKANGVEVGASARDDTSALHFACQKGHTLIAKRLLGKGANVNAKNRKGVTPLMMAAQKGKRKCPLSFFPSSFLSNFCFVLFKFHDRWMADT